MFLRQNRFKIFVFIGLLVFLGGCGRTISYQRPTPEPVYEQPRKGVYHKVKTGETLWRIAKAYQVSVNRIVASNNIPNVAKIQKNQLVFIPEAEYVRNIVLEDDQGAGEFSWPLDGKVVSYYRTNGGTPSSSGIGIRGRVGQLVKASREGRVVFADYLNGYAQTVILDHNDGYYSVYAQNSKLNVDVGSYVLKGDPIAQVGGNGRLAYLHFEIRQNSKSDNPLYYLP